jgi:5'-methylthioinosine phosphorylase
MAITLGVIGGTGLTQMKELDIISREVVHTPYGEPSGAITHGIIGDQEIVFLPRHGYTHHIPPHKVNYRANIWALREVGINHLIAVAAVGGITPEMRPSRLVIPDQVIDYTYDRPHTFFSEDLTEVTHIDFSEPYCEELRQHMLSAAKKINLDVADAGTYAATQGPRLETAAEINRLERDGNHIVGMTGMPEASLAKEAGLCYATCAVVANYAAGKADTEITMDNIHKTLKSGMADVKKLLTSLSVK